MYIILCYYLITPAIKFDTKVLFILVTAFKNILILRKKSCINSICQQQSKVLLIQ